jgi:hypothetical protein
MSNPMTHDLQTGAIEACIAYGEFMPSAPMDEATRQRAREQLTALLAKLRELEAEKDTQRLDFLAGEMEREADWFKRGGFYASVFRRNAPITREAIDKAMAFAEAGTAYSPTGSAGGET